jgi:hypothetical protein
MFTIAAHQGTRQPMAARNAGARLRHFAAVLPAVVRGLLASFAIVPTALAMPVPVGHGGSAGVAPVPATTVRVVATGGMAGWQITLIALGAALLAATAAVLLYRALAVRRAAPAAAA